MGRRNGWAVVAALCGPTGIAVGMLAGKFHLLRPSPGIFFALGAMATLCVVGLVLGIRSARRTANAGEFIGN